MTGDRLIAAAKPERRRRDVAGLTTPAPPPVEVVLERDPDPARVVEVVLIAATEDGDLPL